MEIKSNNNDIISFDEIFETIEYNDGQNDMQVDLYYFEPNELLKLLKEITEFFEEKLIKIKEN